MNNRRPSKKNAGTPGARTGISRRDALRWIAFSVPAAHLAASTRLAAADAPPRFEGTRESLSRYRCPDWFPHAKLGIWAHWGPQSAAEYGDWYARNLYIEGTRQNRYHVRTYGHPSKFGYKDVIPTWKGDAFDPDHLLRLYKKAGARYFMSMGAHVDNFDLWNSRHTRWNAAKMGIKRDVVAAFRKATLAQGLRFGVSDHLWMSYKWMSVSRGSDKEGEFAGVPYDGFDLQYRDLYGDCPRVYRQLPWDEDDIPDKWKQEWFNRIKDLIDQSQPDIVYSDGQIPFGEWGLKLVAHLYNQSAALHDGRVEAVFTSKREQDSAEGLCVFDKERGVVEGIWPRPWQLCTCVGKWHYDKEAVYKTPKRIIDMLVDVVSRNGNLLLNFPLPNSGALDSKELQILDDITRWIAVNGESIFDTRPWKIYGQGGEVKEVPGVKYNEASLTDFTSDITRFTTKGSVLYAFFMGWPGKEVTIAPLATGKPYVKGRVQSVGLVGSNPNLKWDHHGKGLTVQLPEKPPTDFAHVLRIEGLET